MKKVLEIGKFNEDTFLENVEQCQKKMTFRREQVVLLIIIFFSILILDQIINRILIKKWNIEVSEEKQYVNQLHKYGEKTLYYLSIIVVVITMMDFHHLRIFIFISLIILCGFHTFMEWKYARESKRYILNAVTCGLIMIGAVVFALL